LGGGKSCYALAMKILFRMGAVILIAAVVFATLGPPRYRPHSPLGQDGEHALAFVLVGLAVGLAFPQRRLLVAAVSVLLIGLLEIMQLWAPGRHARLEDFLVDAATACIGLAFAAAIGWFAARWSGSKAR
jgi:VanZ family protein